MLREYQEEIKRLKEMLNNPNLMEKVVKLDTNHSVQGSPVKKMITLHDNHSEEAQINLLKLEKEKEEIRKEKEN